MAEITVINASPRAPRSNSKIYAGIFSNKCKTETEYLELNRKNGKALAESAAKCRKLVLVFPLYADGIPVTLLNFLKLLEENPPAVKPEVSMIVNCGFLECSQNDVAVEQIRIFCETNGYTFGSALRIASGEAIAKTPFKFLVVRKIKKFAEAVEKGSRRELKVTMPLTKKTFLKAADVYWLNLGKMNGLTKEDMSKPEIEE